MHENNIAQLYNFTLPVGVWSVSILFSLTMTEFWTANYFTIALCTTPASAGSINQVIILPFYSFLHISYTSNNNGANPLYSNTMSGVIVNATASTNYYVNIRVSFSQGLSASNPPAYGGAYVFYTKIG